jgi:anti-sigma regulatory factor (Ser/Thr protein kinase)
VELRARLGGEAIEVSHARHLFAEHLMLWGVAADDVAVLLVSELVTNAFVHGAPPVELRARRTAEGLRVEVRDGAPEQPVMRDTPLDLPGGQGLRLVDALATRWGWSAAEVGKAVWFEIDQPAHSAGPAGWSAARPEARGGLGSGPSGLVAESLAAEALAAEALAAEAIPRLTSRGSSPAGGTIL